MKISKRTSLLILSHLAFAVVFFCVIFVLFFWEERRGGSCKSPDGKSQALLSNTKSGVGIIDTYSHYVLEIDRLDGSDDMSGTSLMYAAFKPISTPPIKIANDNQAAKYVQWSNDSNSVTVNIDGWELIIKSPQPNEPKAPSQNAPEPGEESK